MFGWGSIGEGHPHDGYIEAVMAELGDDLGPDCETAYGAYGTDGAMTAFLDLGGIDCDPDDPEPRAALAWSSGIGWLCGAWDGTVLEVVRALTVAAVPVPADVARAGRARAAAGILPLDALSIADAPETPTAALTAELQEAVDAGHLTAEVAGRLARYAD